jgi:hypothetical protein
LPTAGGSRQTALPAGSFALIEQIEAGRRLDLEREPATPLG